TCGLGVTTRWIVIEGGPDFFAVTKQLHNALHGEAGNGSELDDQARRIYNDTLKDNGIELLTLLRPGDIVVLHDPQTAGLAPILADHGVLVLWRCHIGRDERTKEVDKAWKFLKGYLKPVIRSLFSRREYVPDFLNDKRSVIIRPSIDPFSPKNQELDLNTIQSILTYTGLICGPLPMSPNLQFKKTDGSTGRIDRHADIIRCGSPPHPDTPLITQISRWDRLKDAKGLILGYKDWLNVSSSSNAELILAGPSVHGVADDPAAPVVFKEVFDAWCQLPHWQRSRVHLVMLPMVDSEENAAIVNALQRHSTVIVQKSLREGFGLTVTEAMWKHKPIIGSKVGGIQ
ncbi:MAG: glycosyltransferase, partial [Desulfobulbia bacterium]